MSTLSYKPHVDGLRAIAVLSVVFYHAYVPGFGGGYVGVDVFFVISGYLITMLLFQEAVETGDISIRNFVLRRIRRLAPALFVVLLACLIASLIWLSPVGGEQQGLAKSTIATLGLLANVYFWRYTGDYFDAPAETHPLLHMWSLSVEEQFYLLWPWLILLVVRVTVARGRRPATATVSVMAVVFAISLAACIIFTPTHPQLTFFLTPFRAWEFAAGGGVFFALARTRNMGRVGGAVALAGLISIISAVYFFEKATFFPGWRALLPVFGAGAVLLGCEASPRCLTARLLSLRVLVGIGLISYSLYLWHWPVLVYAHMATLRTPELPTALFLCAVATVLAWITYVWVENPVRRGRYGPMTRARGTFKIAAVTMGGLVVMASGVGIWAKIVWPSIGNHRAEAAAIVATTLNFEFCAQPRPYSGHLMIEPGCGTGKSRNQMPAVKPVRTLLWGDSHAAHLVPAMVKASATLGEQVLIRNIPECPPLRGARLETGTRRYRESCWRFNKDVVADLATQERFQIRTLVLAARWRAYATLPKVRAALTRELRSTLSWAVGEGFRVIIVAPVPEFDQPVPPCLARRSEANCGVSRRKSESDRLLAMRMIQIASSGLDRVQIVDPFDALCDRNVCRVRTPDAVLYSDDNHLALKGSEMLTELLTNALTTASLIPDPSQNKGAESTAGPVAGRQR